MISNASQIIRSVISAASIFLGTTVLTDTVHATPNPRQSQIGLVATPSSEALHAIICESQFLLTSDSPFETRPRVLLLPSNLKVGPNVTRIVLVHFAS